MTRQMVLPITDRGRLNGTAPVTAAPATPPPATVEVEVEVAPAVPAEVPATTAPAEGHATAVAQPVPGVPRLMEYVTTLAVMVVALAAGVGSYEHMRDLAMHVGEGGRAWLFPLSVDGLAVAASMTMFVRRRTGQTAGVLPWAALLVSLGASLAANVAAAEPTLAGRLVAAWPPLGLLLS